MPKAMGAFIRYVPVVQANVSAHTKFRHIYITLWYVQVSSLFGKQDWMKTEFQTEVLALQCLFFEKSSNYLLGF